MAKARDALRLTPVLAVTGPAGIGKTAFALALHAALLRDEDPSVRNALLLSLDARPPGRLVPYLLDVLSRIAGLPSDLRALAADPTLAVSTLIDVADTAGWWILLDAAEHTDQTELFELVRAISGYARRSRWVVTSAEVPERLTPHLSHVALRELMPHERAAVAARIAPGTGATATDLPGSPRDLLLALRSGDERAEVHERARAALATLRRPLPLPVLLALPGFPDEAALSQLIQLGEVLDLPRGIWLRRELGDTANVAPAATSLGDLARALADQEDDSARLEAIRLLAQTRQHGRFEDLLRQSAERLCEAGFAADLWSVLAALPSDVEAACPSAIHWRRWAAFEWGDREAANDIAAAEQDRSATYPALHLRARQHISVGDFAEAFDLAMAAADAATNPDERDRALCRAARCRISQGQYNDAITIVDSCSQRSGDVRVECVIALGEALAGLGSSDEANAAIDRMLVHAEDLSPAARFRLLLGGARVRLITQRLIEAEPLIDLLVAARAEHIADGVSARTALELAASVAVQRGRFALLHELAQRLLLLERAFKVRALFVRSFVASANIWLLPADQVLEELETLERDARAHASPIASDVAAYVPAQRAVLATLCGQPPADHNAPTEHRNTWLARATNAYRSIHGARWGLPPLIDVDAQGDSAEHALQVQLVRASLRLGAGAESEALAEFVATREKAIGCGHTLYALHAAQGACLAAACGEGGSRLLTEATAYKAVAETEARRGIMEAAFFEAAAQEGNPDPQLLLRWANTATVATTVFRWSRWLLGADVALDPVEQRMVRACLQRSPRGRGRASVLTLHAHSIDWNRAVVVDELRRFLSSASERADLDRNNTLWTLLLLLVRRGRASKEELVLEVWNVREYHPLNHDNRLRVAARKLRALLEGLDTSASIETTDDGYALAGPWLHCPLVTSPPP